MKIYFKSLSIIVLLCSVANVSAGIAVIAHPDLGVASVDVKTAKKLFLGKVQNLGGTDVKVVDQTPGSEIYATFYKTVCKKNANKLKLYWTKMVLSGKGNKLEVKGDGAAVKAYVASTPNAIGFVDESLVDSSVKSLYIAN